MDWRYILVIIILVIIVGGTILFYVAGLNKEISSIMLLRINIPEKVKDEEIDQEDNDIVDIVGNIVQNNNEDTIVVEGNIGGIKGPTITTSVKVDHETIILFFQGCEGKDELYSTRRAGMLPELTEELLKRLSVGSSYVMIKAKKTKSEEYKAIVIIKGSPPMFGCGAPPQ